MNQENLFGAADACLRARGYTLRQPHLVPLLPPQERVYHVKTPDGNQGCLYVEGSVLYKDFAEGPDSAITWTGLFTAEEGLKVLAIDAMVAPAALMRSISAPEGLRPRVTFRAGAKDPNDPEQVLEDLMPMLDALEHLVRGEAR